MVGAGTFRCVTLLKRIQTLSQNTSSLGLETILQIIDPRWEPTSPTISDGSAKKEFLFEAHFSMSNSLRHYSVKELPLTLTTLGSGIFGRASADKFSTNGVLPTMAEKKTMGSERTFTGLHRGSLGHMRKATSTYPSRYWIASGHCCISRDYWIYSPWRID